MKRSKFNLSHRLLATGDFGYLYPILVEDVLPGDKFKISSEVYMKAIPLLAPILESVDVRVDYFFVPNRLLWSKWQEFITGGRNGTSDLVSPYFNPFIQTDTTTNTKYFDALTSHLYQIGLKSDAAYNEGHGLDFLQLDALPLCAYNKIYYDWYVDENLENIPQPDDADCPYFIKDGDVDDHGALEYHWLKTDQPLSNPLNPFCLRQRKYKKDYFTSSLPWPQRGPEVAIDLPPNDVLFSDLEGHTEVDSGFPIPETFKNVQVDTQGKIRYQGLSQTDVVLEGDTYTDLRFDKGTLGSVSIPELRRLSAIQRWFERNARWGSRYIEQILSHFGVRTPDYRLDRSEYLGGTICPINVSETYQTAEGTTGQETADVLGQYAGHLTSYGVNGCRKLRAQEHGWLIGLLSVVPRASYGQGLQKRFTRPSRLDYAWPEFAAIGEQSVLRREVLVSPDHATNNQTFGYQRRYAEYMSRQDRFDQNMLNSFPYWHLGRIFVPTGASNILSSGFLECTPGYTKQPTNQDRIFAYTPNDLYTFDRFHFIYQINNHVSCKRPIPKYVSPVLK